MTPEQDLYQQALVAIHAGDLAKAREIFARLLKSDRKNIDYWLWMSAVVETPKERVYCLREVLALDPENQDAALGLRLLGENAPELTGPIPFEKMRAPWKTSLEIADELPSASKGMRSRVVVYSLLGVAIIGLFIFGIMIALKPKIQLNDSPILRWTVTPVPTATETLKPTATPTGQAALSIVLEVTFTPTPLYVATPHNRLEAYNSGLRAYGKGDWVKAEEYFKQVLVDEPNSADVYYHLGDVYRFQGKYSDAITAYNAGIKIDPNFAPSYLGKGRALLEETPSKPEDALSNLQKAIELDPQLYEAYIELANSNLALGDPAAAVAWLDKLDSAYANTAQVELIRAQAYLLSGQDKEALASIKKANVVDRSLLSVYKVWGQALQNTGDFSSSIPPLLTVIEYAPSDHESQAMLARAYYETGDADKAFSLLSTVLKQDSKSINAYLLRAEIYLKQGKIDEASADYTSVLRIDYNNFDANLGKGRIFLAQTLAGAAFNAFDYTEKFAKTGTQKAILLYWRGKALIGLDEPEAAIKKFEAALAFPDSVLPADLRTAAEEQLAELYTPTPTQKATETPAPGKTPTVKPTNSP